MRKAFLQHLRPGSGTAVSRKKKRPSNSSYPPPSKDAWSKPKLKRLERGKHKQIHEVRSLEEYSAWLKAKGRPEPWLLLGLDYSPTLDPGWRAVRAESFKIGGRLRPVVAWLIPDTPNAALSKKKIAEPQARGSVSLMAGFVQILSTPTVDSVGATLLLEFTNRRYLFGQVAEGTTRLLTEQKQSLTKLEHVFVTGCVSWRNYGGLFGLLLSVADVAADQSREGLTGKKAEGREKLKPLGLRSSLTIHGAQNLTHFMATARTFIFRRTFDAQLREMRTDPRLDDPTNTKPDFEDDNIMVWRLCLYAGSGKRGHEEVDGSDVLDNWEKTRPRPPWAKDIVFEDKTPEILQAEHEVREGVVKAMFSSGTMKAIQAARLPDVEMPACILQAGEGNKAKFYDGPPPGGKNCPDTTVGVVSTIDVNDVQWLPGTQHFTDSISYIVKCRDRRGRFNPDKAKALGVKTTDFKRLTNKETVAGKDGMEVTPEMVLEPDIKGRAFAVIQCQRLYHWKSLQARPEWRDKNITDNLDVIYWIPACGEERDSSSLRDFAASFPNTRHVVLTPGPSSNPFVFESSAAHTIRLNQIDRDRFPIGFFQNGFRTGQGEHGLGSNLYEGRPGAIYRLAPRPGPDDSQVRDLVDMTAAAKEVGTKPEVVALAKAARRKVAGEAFLQEVAELEKDMPSRDAEVVTLGTGSAAPSKYRNVSATLVRVPGHGSYLFDCGENTLGQLKRTYGPTDGPRVLRDLRVIFVSHLHADHHMGVANMIVSWMGATKHDDPPPNLCIMANKLFLEWIREYNRVQYLCISRLTLLSMGQPRATAVDTPCTLTWDYEERLPGVLGPWPEKDWPRLLSTLGLAKVDAWYVDHTPTSVAVMFEWPTGLRVAYSGDCRPSAYFAKAAQDVDLLIHECTFDDNYQEHAVFKKHSTMSEALAVARDCRARRVLLTHFSQRYPKIARLSAGAHDMIREAGNPPVLVAFDGMRVKLGDFRAAEQFRPALEKLYEDEDASTSVEGLEEA